MNDSPEALAVAMVAHRFADEDAARRRWLDDKLLAERVDEVEIPRMRPRCKRGHNDWVVMSGARRCRTCHRLAMVASRARRGL
jgi:hypothetical protein